MEKPLIQYLKSDIGSLLFTSIINNVAKGVIRMKFIDLLKSHKIYPVYAAVVLYTLTFSLAAVIAPSTANAAENTQGIHQAEK